MNYQEILLLDDDSQLMFALAFIIQLGGYQIMLAPDVETALEELKNYHFDLAIIRCPRKEAGPLELLKKIKDSAIKVMVAGEAQGNLLAPEALEIGADDYLLLPCHPQLLYRRVAECLAEGQGRGVRLTSSRGLPGKMGGAKVSARCRGALLALAAELIFLS